MIFEYAVSPEYFSNIESIKNIRDNFGIESGRIISEIPCKKWKEIVFNIIKKSENQDAQKKKMLNTIISMQKKKTIYKRNEKIELHNEDWQDFNEKLWIEYTKSTHAIRPFKAIITEDCEETMCLSLNDFDRNDSPLWHNPHDIIIKREHKTMIDIVKPILDCAKEVILVDRNFDPSQARFRFVLIELMKTLANRTYSPFIRSMVYHTGDIRRYHKNNCITKELFPEYCRKHLQKEIPYGMKLKVAIWSKDELHDRFILTDICGVNYTNGLDESLGHNSETTHAVRLSMDSYDNEWKKFTNKKADFEITNDSI